MSKKKVLRWFLIALAVAVTGAVVALLVSPYRGNNLYPVPAVVESVVIEQPADSVFRFLGKSANASKWSVYVDTIVSLNPEMVADGAPGSLRRCFTARDRSGIRWDEEITVVERDSLRQLTIFNPHGFPIMAPGVATEQRYTPLGAGRTRLTFTLFFKSHRPTLTESLKMRIGAYKVAGVYRQNLANIKAVVESRPLPHPRP